LRAYKRFLNAVRDKKDALRSGPARTEDGAGWQTFGARMISLLTAVAYGTVTLSVKRTLVVGATGENSDNGALTVLAGVTG
jgi:hypothetical protein